jgi:uncharacterized protein (DUF58 family)
VSPLARPLVTGAALIAAGWALGSTPLSLAGAGLGVAGAIAVSWGAAARRIRVERRPTPAVLTEGEALEVTVTLRAPRLLPGTFRFTESVGPLDAKPIALRRGRPTSLRVGPLPRGIHVVGPGRFLADDPLGLVRLAGEGPPGSALRVRPRVVELDGTFVEGAFADGGTRRRATVRLAGSEPHGIRAYRDGESLRAVHWVSSARRGRLMVREMEEPPRDESSVVLDLDVAGSAGPPGASSLDEATRAAAALVRAGAIRGRRTGLLLAGPRAVRFTVASLGTDWEEALDALAAAEAVPGGCAAALLGRDAEAGLVLVTGRPLEHLAPLLLRERAAAVVAVDAPTYAGAPASAPEPALLRLAAAGVPVAILRAGDDLASVLSRPAAVRRA